MSTAIHSTRFIAAVTVPEGAGVTVQRTIGTPALRNYDPFVMLDYFSSDNPDDYIAGFPSHPHRGFSTFTYMIDGLIEHRDSMGNSGILGPGSAQLMKAASGVIHSEMPQQENGLMRGFQLWINLPAANKMDTPEYQEFQSSDFPMIKTEDYTLKLLIGQFGGFEAPISDDITQVSYFDVELKAHRHFQHRAPAQHNSFMYVFEGSGELNGRAVPPNTLIALGDGDAEIDFVAAEQGARLLITSGKPIDEPVVQYGPFVMNSKQEIEQAMHDFHSNNFVRDRAWMNRKKA
jgi:hypothetical protein